ncbi:MAG: LamG domain-containing protein, partial [Akkermansiaceae bacterium]|nr:LamG domain-containing protein [Akkermansiaceae bacterium]
PSAIDFSRDFTLATWVNVGNYYAEMPVLFKGRADLTAAPDKFFGVFGIEGLQVHGEGQGEWITNYRASNGLVPNDGGWHHIAVTYRAAEAPHFTLYVDGQGKTPADKGTFRGGDFTMKPDAPDSVLRIGCRADGDTWRYVRSHLRGLLDELQIYDEALKAGDIRFLFEHPGSVAGLREAVTSATSFQFDPGHPWRPPFGVERVGLTPVIVQFASDTRPAPEHWLAAYREGKEVERKALDVSGNSPFTARVTFATSPAPEELVLLAKDKDGKAIERARWKVERPAFEADAEATVDPVINPVDLGAILPPADWLVLGPRQQARVTLAAFSGKEEVRGAEVFAWFESSPDRPSKAAIELPKGIRAELKIALPPPALTKHRDTLHLTIRDAQGRELWHKTITTMLMLDTPPLPAFGAIETKLRYDYPLLSYSGPDEVTEMPYDKAWAPERQDVVVALPNGSRFVFWRGAAYTPFWAGKHNTALNFEFAEAPRRPDGLDCIDAASDKELRRSRVEIIESTAARVHVRWTAQPCDLNYKVWGETATEDFYFYPDGFGSRTMTLQAEPEAEYEIEELLILTPPAAYPLRVLPENLVDVLFRDGSKRELKYPLLAQEPDYEKLMSGEQPPLYRIRFGAREPLSAVYFNPGWNRLPVMALRPFYSQGQMVTPFYWGNHLPLARRKPTGHNIDDLASMTPAHNAMMSWGHRRPQPLESRTAEMPDALGVTRKMKVEKWAWLIGLSDADDARLLEWSRSFATPPQVQADGARLQTPSYSTERRATLLSVDKPEVSLTITPSTPCVHPVFELQGAPKTLSRLELDGRELTPADYAWDGRTLWLNATLRKITSLRLKFTDTPSR